MSKFMLSIFSVFLLLFSCTNNVNKYIRFYSDVSIDVPVSYAIINTGITITGNNVAKLDSTSHDKIVKGLCVINKYGVKELTTANSNFGTDYDNKENFVSSQSYKMKFYDIDKIDGLRADLLNVGFNVFNIVSYGSDSLQKYEKELSKKVVKNAQEKANELSENSGIKIGKIFKIVNGREPSEDANDDFTQIVNTDIFCKSGFAEGIDDLLKHVTTKPTIIKKTFTITNSFTVYFEILDN